MKKTLLIILFIVFLTVPAHAFYDYKNQCPISPYKETNFGRYFANATGTNAMVENIVAGIIKSEIRKAIGQDFDVTLKIFGVNELVKGEFKSLTAMGKNIKIEGFNFSSLSAQTLCDFNSININSKPISLNQNIVLNIAAEFSTSDLINTIEYKNYAKEFSKINLTEVGISAFYVYSRTIEVKDGKLYFMINATPNGPYKPMDISIGADIKVRDGRITTSNIEFINLYTGFELTQLSKVLGGVTNLNFPIKLQNGKNAQIQIQNIDIVADKIQANAIVFIPK